MSGTAIENFFVALGFEVDSSDLKTFKKDIDSAKDAMMAVVTAAGVAAAAIGVFVQSVAAGVDELGDFAEAEQVGIDVISELGYAAQLSGASIDSVKSSISGVNKVVGEAALGIGRGAMTFRKLGMDAKNADGTVKTFDEILGEVAGKMDGMSRQESIAMAEKLGIDRKLIPLLVSGKDNIEALRKEARAFGAITKRDAQIAGAYMDAFDRTVFMVKGLARGIATELMPAMTQMMNGMRQWFLANREVVMSGIGKFLQIVIALLGVFWDWTMRIITALVNLVSWLTSTNAGLAITAFVLAVIAKIAVYKSFAMLSNVLRVAWAWITVFNVSALITAAVIGGIVIALALLIDEFINFQEGNESFIGDLIRDFPELGAIITQISDGIAAVWSYLQSLWNEIAPAMAGLGSAFMNLFSSLVPVVSLLWEAFKIVASFLLPIFLWFATIIVEAFAGVIGNVATAIAVIIGKVASGLNFIANMFNVVFGGIRDFVDNAFQAMFGFVDKFLGKITTAINFVGKLLGVGSVSGAVTSGLGPTDALGNSLGYSSAFEPTGAIGIAANPLNASRGGSTITSTQQVQAPITIMAQSPADAAKGVTDAFDRMNRESIRNSQSAVKL